MKERPILFSAPMVRAILDGRKTQTRRVVKPQTVTAALLSDGIKDAATGKPIRCHYGQPGDRLWVREAFRFLDSFDGDSPATVGDLCMIAGYPKPWAPTQYEADGYRDNWMNVGASPGSVTPGKLRPGIHMPRWASRILLEVTGVRVERLQDISEANCIAEGVESVRNEGKYWRDYSNPDGRDCVSMTAVTPVESYRTLWESINGPGSWAANPWVWVVEYKRVPA